MFHVVRACEHETLDDAELRIKKWLPRGSPIHTALTDIVTDPKILGDLPHLTRFSHSGELEVFHALCNMYCPKRFGFCYSGMYARTKLAVMDHNSCIHRNQSRTKQGHLRFKTVYSRITSSWVAKKIMDKKDRHFRQEILQAIWSVGCDKDKQIICELEDPPRPPRETVSH